MKKLIFVLSLLFSLSTFANCKIFVEKESFYWQGYTINFSFTDLFKKLKYEQTLKKDDANFLMQLTGAELDQGPFKKAEAKFILSQMQGNVLGEVSEAKTCFTQSCTAGDFGKVFSKAYKSASSELPVCSESM